MVTPPPASPFVRAVRALLPLVVLGLHAALYLDGEPARTFGFPLDDAWIHRVYARSLAFGAGFSFNPGQPESGATSPLWAVVTAPVEGLTAAAGVEAGVIAVKLIGLACAAWFLVRTAGFATRITGDGNAGAAAAALTALDGRLLFSALSGMENALLIALTAEAVWALLAGRVRVGAALLGLSVTARPEMLIVAPPLWAACTWAVRGPRALLDPVAWALLFGPWFLWSLRCRLVTGAWLPATALVKGKVDLSADNIARVVQTTVGYGWPAAPAAWAAALVAVPLLRRLRRAHVPVIALFAGVPALYTAGVAVSRVVHTSGYYWQRWLDGPGVWLSAGLCIAAAAVASGAVGRACAAGSAAAERGLRVLGAALIVAALPAVTTGIIERRDRFTSDALNEYVLGVVVGRWIDENTPPGAVIAGHDAGAHRYFGRRVLLDLLGLNHAGIAADRVTPLDELNRADYLVAYEAVARREGWLDGGLFVPVHHIGIPLDRYTLTGSQQNNVFTIWRRADR